MIRAKSNLKRRLRHSVPLSKELSNFEKTSKSLIIRNQLKTTAKSYVNSSKPKQIYYTTPKISL